MDQWLFAPTHGLSQLITSFIAGKSQGILRTPFSTFSAICLSLDSLFFQLYFELSLVDSSTLLSTLVNLSVSVCQRSRGFLSRSGE